MEGKTIGLVFPAGKKPEKPEKPKESGKEKAPEGKEPKA